MSKLLIVSDSTRFRAWARLVVEADGYAVLEARDGLAALQYAVEDGPTLILIDPDLATGPVDRERTPKGAGLSNGSERTTDSSRTETACGLSASDVQNRLMLEPQTEAIPVVVPFSAFVRSVTGERREGATARAIRRSTATLSLRETISSVLSSDPTIGRGEYVAR